MKMKMKKPIPYFYYGKTVNDLKERKDGPESKQSYNGTNAVEFETTSSPTK